MVHECNHVRELRVFTIYDFVFHFLYLQSHLAHYLSFQGVQITVGQCQRQTIAIDLLCKAGIGLDLKFLNKVNEFELTLSMVSSLALPKRLRMGRGDSPPLFDVLLPLAPHWALDVVDVVLLLLPPPLLSLWGSVFDFSHGRCLTSGSGSGCMERSVNIN